MKNKRICFLFVLLMSMMTFSLSFSAWAKGWTAQEDGSYVYIDKSGTVLESDYFADKNLGLVKIGEYWYCYRANGSMYKGLLKHGKDWYYFKASNGRMLVNKRVKIKKKYYYFGEDGKRVVYTWVGHRYYGKNGVQVFSRFVDGRYVTKKGYYAKGKKTIKGNVYYFDPETGAMLTNEAKTINGKTWYFDSSGIGRAASPSGTVVESTYFTDPEVDDETLLSAIIYSESGNQPYYGQVAVGLVIMNRVKSPLFPNILKDVIYAKDQFEPARNEWLTNVLKGKIYVTESCKAAAKEAVERAAANNFKIRNTDTDKIVNMKGYLFFMTPAAYQRLQLKSKHIVLRDHVFFKKWQR